jgi:hypothetical protein
MHAAETRRLTKKKARRKSRELPPSILKASTPVDISPTTGAIMLGNSTKELLGEKDKKN